MLLSGWFGWSVLWLLPLLVRVCRACVLKRAAWKGQGSIRVWLGTLLTLLASSGLEALVAEDGPAVGRAVADALSSAGGTALATLLMLAVAATAIPWLFGSSIAAIVRRLKNRSGAPRMQRPAPTLPASAPQHPAPARALRAAATTRREPWRLPKPASGRHPKEKFAAASAVPVARTAAEQPRTEWAPFESIRPTPAMLARARAEQAQAQSDPLPRFARLPPSAVRHAGSGATTLRGTQVETRQADAAGTTGAPASQPATTPYIAPAPATDTPIANRTETAAPVLPELPELPVVASRSGPKDFSADTQLLAPQPEDTALPPIVPMPAPTVTVYEQAADEPPPSAPARPVLHSAASLAWQAPADHDITLPGIDLLDRVRTDAVEIPAAELEETGKLIEQRLKEFKVPVTVLGAGAGPVITRFEIEPATGVRGAQIVGLMKDLSRALGLTSIRVVETIPGKTCMGLELPNAKRQTIRLSEMLESDAYRSSASSLTLAMGKDITGVPVVTDLARAPHMLVAGTTGSGKSVAINAMILSLLYKATPEDVRMIMIDPKMLELSVYDGIPHLLAPVVTDMKLAANALNWCVGEMEKRYRLMSTLGVRNLAGYNQKIRDAEASERKVPNPFSLTPDAPEPLSTLPLVVVVIDELADLMMVAGKKIEELIARLAQKARAAGIHLILATQRPSVDVITGLIKANIPTRVAFQVSSKIDSRTVLDQMGAESLLGHGDMLFLPPGSGYPQRVHGAFVSDEEVHRVVEHLKQFGEPQYEEAILAGPASEEAASDLLGDEPNAESDPLYDEAVAFVVRSRRASISSVQRQLRIGYNRAARLVEQMESAGVVSAMAANGSREILVPASTS